MEILKNFATLAIVVAAVYFSYQFFIGPSEEEFAEEEESIPAYNLPSIPETCSSPADNLEKAIYGHGSNRSSAAQLNRAHRKLESCLRESGFSDAEIRGLIEQIRIKIQGYLKQDGY